MRDKETTSYLLLYQLSLKSQICQSVEIKPCVREMGACPSHILKQHPWNAPIVPEGLLKQAEDMSDKAGGLTTHAPFQASSAHIYARETRSHKLSLLHIQQLCNALHILLQTWNILPPLRVRFGPAQTFGKSQNASWPRDSIPWAKTADHRCQARLSIPLESSPSRPVPYTVIQTPKTFH